VNGRGNQTERERSRGKKMGVEGRRGKDTDRDKDNEIWPILLPLR